MRVRLDIYDLAGGALRRLPLQHHHSHNIWPHVVLVAYSREYTFNGEEGVKIISSPQRRCGDDVDMDSQLRRMGLRQKLARLHDSVDLGTTQPGVTLESFEAFLAEAKTGQFAAQKFNLLDNSCIHFAQACADHLIGTEENSPASKKAFESLLTAPIRAKRLAGLASCLLVGSAAFAVSRCPPAPPLRSLDQTSWTG